MADKPLKTVTVDGLSIETTDQGAQVIEKLQRLLGDTQTALSTAQSEHQKALAAKDADLAKKDAEIDDLKGKVLDAKALDVAVQARGDLVAKAKVIAPNVATDGKTDAEIRHAVVVAKLGDEAVKDKSAVYVDARFDILAETVKPADPVRDALNRGVVPTGDRAVIDQAHAGMVSHLQDAWKNKGAA